MKKKIFFYLSIFFICSVFFFASCGRKRPTPNFYENLYTGEVLTTTEFDSFRNELSLHYSDSLKEPINLHFMFYSQRILGDSIIQPFKYSIKVGTKYIIRERAYEKIDMEVLPKSFLAINGDSIIIGGEQEKPTLINLWFVGCPGCIAEIPVLNKLQEKYADKMNFIAMTFEDKKDVEKFLKKRPFNFIHIPNSEDFIDYIGTHPYPESIFINRHGCIKYIEGVISGDDSGFKQFDVIIEELLLQE
jgi:thiol-disulfide isomerase/thioredoxin